MMRERNKILIVDDDFELGQELAEALEDDYTVTHVLDGSSALSAIRGEQFDLCIVDYKLPDTTGSAVVSAIKDHNYETKVLVLSGKPYIAKTLQEDNVSSLVAEVIQKPFDPIAFFRTVDDLLP